MFADSRFITIRGILIHYRVALPRERPRHRVLLVPAPGATTECWRLIVPELLRAGCMCVLCDLPGYGLSGCAPDVPQRQDLRARFLWGLLDVVDQSYGGKLNCWHLMGHSAAAGTVATMAMTQPESVASLFMISPVLYRPYPAILSRILSGNLGELLATRLFRKIVLNRRRFRRLAERIYGCPLSERAIGRLYAPFTRMIGSEKMLRNLILDGFEVDTDKLGGLFIPSMVLWGGRDQLLGGHIPKRLRERDFKEAEYHVLRGSGHCAMETNARAVCDYLRGWIREMWQ